MPNFGNYVLSDDKLTKISPTTGRVFEYKIIERRADGRILMTESQHLLPTGERSRSKVLFIDLDLLATKSAEDFADLKFFSHTLNELMSGVLYVSSLVRPDEKIVEIEDHLLLTKEERKRRRAGRKAASTRAKNEKKGISQSGLTGTTRQKQWAAEIRGGMQAKMGDSDDFAALVRNATSASFWIEKRNLDPAALAKRYIALVTANNDMVAKVNALTPGKILSADESALFDAHYAARAKLDAFLNPRA